MVDAPIPAQPTAAPGRPAALLAGLYLTLAVLDLLLLDGGWSLLLAAVAALAGLGVLSLTHWTRGRLVAAGALALTVAALTVHVVAAPGRPLVAVLLVVSAASAWVVLAATGVRARPAHPYVADPVESDTAPVAAPAAGPDPEPEAAEPDVRLRLMAAADQLLGDAVVALVEPDGEGGLRVSASTQPELVGAALGAGTTSAAEHTYRTGEQLFLADPRQDPLVSPTLLRRTGSASMLWQPVRVDDVPCAVLVVGWTEPLDAVPQPAVQAVDLLAAEAAEFIGHEFLLADLEHFASTDVLTGLDSRAAWDAQLDELMADARANDHSLVVAMIDLDHFRDFNETHGHAAGDAHLARFARAARATMRCDGVIARWGGEEFAVALTAITPEAAGRVLDRVRLAVPDGRTCSIGYAVWDRHESGVHLVSRADRGLHRAKADGRNRVRQAT